MSGIANGTVFGNRYIVQSQVGTGGMATVYRGVDSTLDRQVAIKVMLPQYASDPAFAQRFRQEARAAAALQNPYIVQVYDWGKDEATGTYYIVMEYLRGTDLKSGIRSHGALAPKKVAQIGAQVCSALAVAHNHEIIHRDIKPQNIMILPNGDAKVMDFGIARAKNSHLTQTNSVLGTAHYVSPEQAQGKELGPTSDLYSLGVVMYEAATGRLPFEGEDAVSVALKQVNEQPVPPRSINPNLDPTLEAIIMCLLQKDPALRFQTADELRHALNSYIQGNSVKIPNYGPMRTTSLPASNTATNVLPAGQTAATARQQAVGHTARMNRAATPDQRRVERREENRVNRAKDTGKSTGLGIAAAVIVLVAIIAAVTFFSLGSCSNGSTDTSAAGSSASSTTSATTGDTVSVPSLANLTQAEATNILRGYGLVVGSVTTQTSSTVEKGKIISQSPVSGTAVQANTTVNIVVSSGTNLVTLSDIRGKTPDEANTIVTGLGLKLSYDATLDAYSSDYAEGTIVTYSPANQQVTEGSTVKYGLSKGAETVTLDNYYGWALSDVQNALSTLGLNYTTSYEYSDDLSEGYVLSTYPSSGQTVKRGDTVTISVSQGKDPNSISLDSYVGQEYTSVKSYLEGLGLNVNLISQTPTSADQSNLCAGTDPHNTTVAKGSTVNLYYYETYVDTSVYVGSYSGYSQSAAVSAIQGLGLSVNIQTGEAAPSADLAGTVASSSPSDTSVAAGSTITVFVYGDYNGSDDSSSDDSSSTDDSGSGSFDNV